MSRRMMFLITTILLIVVEVLIALYVHDDWIRPYAGDMIVVVAVYTFVRIWLPGNCPLLPLYVFLFAVLVEVLQKFHIVEVLGLSDSRFFSILIGGVFDPADIFCYGAGCTLPGLYEYWNFRRSRERNRERKDMEKRLED